MKYIIQEGTFKKSKSIFVFTGVFLIALFGYQLYDHLELNEFNYGFPGDWDKVLGIIVGIFLIFRSSVFTVRSRDLFIEVTGAEVKYRMNRRKPIKKINRSDIDKLEVKKGQVVVFTKESKRITIVDFNEVRIRDDKRDSIIEALRQSMKEK
jgi:hypothetical protein